MTEEMRKTTRLRKLLAEPGIIAMPCSYDSLTAKLIEKTGYKIVGVTGAGVCAAVLGVPDVGLMTMTEVLNQTKNIVNATNLPVICDCDNGYGGPVNVMRTVREFEEAGVAGFWMEDQIFPKRCGHFEGKKIVSREEMITKIEAAVETRRDPDLVIIARTDAKAVFGLDEAISRARDYVKAGADMIFVEAPQSRDELRKIAFSIEAPQMVNLVEGGKTPLVTVRELDEMGFKIASFSGSSQKIAIKAIQKFLSGFHETGDIRLYLDDMVSLEERSRLLGLDDFYEFESKFLNNTGEQDFSFLPWGKSKEADMSHIWDKHLTKLDSQVYEKAGFGHRAGFGTRPAILIIDVQYRTCGEEPKPILEAIDEYKTSCGETGWKSVRVIEALLAAARPRGVPILYPVVERKDRFETGRWKDKIPAIADKTSYIGNRGTQIIESIAPEQGDVIVSKRYASAFFGTPLMTYLNDLDRDTIIVTGATTSGCVRATVADAFSYGFNVVVVEDGVFDRGEVSHAINLFDMDQKWADVMSSEDVIQYIEKLPLQKGDQ